MRNLLLWAICGITTLDDEETEPVSTLELYAPTMAQDIIIKIPVEMTSMIYDYFHVVILFHLN